MDSEEKIYNFIKGSNSFRLTQDEADFLNDNKTKFLPDTDEKIGCRELVFEMAQRAISRVDNRKSLPSDVETIQKLKDENAELKRIQDENRLNTDSLLKEKEALQMLLSEKELIIDQLQSSISNTENENNRLQLENVNQRKRLIPDNALVIQVSPLELAVVNRMLDKMAATGVERIDPGVLVFSAFWLYHTSKMAFDIPGLPKWLSHSEIKQIEKETRESV